MDGIRRNVTHIVAGAAIAVAALLASLSGVPAAGADTGVCPANPSPVNADDPAIEVHSPTAGSTVSSPLSVSGLARVFEATVSVEVYDQDGNVIAEDFTTAEAGAPDKAPYSTSVPFTVASTQPGCLRVFEGSAQDGSPTNVVQVEVTLAAPAAGPTPQPPATGTGTARGGDGLASAWLVVVGGGILVLAVAGQMHWQRRHRRA